MSGTAATQGRAFSDPYHLGHDSGESAPAWVVPGRGEGGPAPKRIITAYGFWIYLLSDIILFSGLFAAYAVLHNQTAGGPAGKDIFDLNTVAVETGALLLSSFTCGMASLAMEARRGMLFQLFMGATFLLGAVFLGIEINEFTGLVRAGNGPDRSAFLSAFFTLVGCHGLHITCGLLWLLTMMAQVVSKGFRADIMRRVMCWALFWHALDIVWVAVFTVVYLLGVDA